MTKKIIYQSQIEVVVVERNLVAMRRSEVVRSPVVHKQVVEHTLVVANRQVVVRMWERLHN